MTAELVEVPSDIVRAVTQRWPERGRSWCSEVRAELLQLCKAYKATPESVLDARYGLVVEVSTATEHLVMRSSPDPNGHFQAKVSEALASLGVAPRIHEVLGTAHGTWTVMDRVIPGTSLAGVDASLVDLASMLAPIATESGPAEIPSLSAWLKERLADSDPIDIPLGQLAAPRHERVQAMAILQDLDRDTVPGLCHGDVSRKNVLSGGPHRWLLVDPRGVSGELAYDVAVIASKLEPRSRASQRASELARLVGVDPDRVQAWLTVASAARV